MRELVSEVAAAYFRHSRVSIAEIPQVISAITECLSSVPALAEDDEETEAPTETARALTPAQIRSSVRSDAIVSFEDGRPYKTLTRHLAARGLTPAEYRAKWGLPPDYPMVAASYSASRAALARRIRLGERGLSARKAAARAGRRSPSTRAAEATPKTPKTEQVRPTDNGAAPSPARPRRKRTSAGRKTTAARK